MAIKHTIGNPLCECIHCTRRRLELEARKPTARQPIDRKTHAQKSRSRKRTNK